MTIYAPIVCVSDLNVSINNNLLLNDVNLSVPAGIWLGVVGPNGGGKSTLIKALMGQVPYRGQIALDWPEQSARRIGYLPQIAVIEPSLPITVSDYLTMVCDTRPVWFRHKQKQAILNAMTRLQIETFNNKRLGTLSAGERQRVLLCAALINQPDILVLDEPLAGVDKEGHALILNVLSEFHQAGGSVIMVEHHWHVVEQYCQFVAVIDGQLVDYGPIEHVFGRLKPNVAPFELATSA
ncbi:metal ABC transporter ATP-binding protein [Pseudoalteromonas spongiae]|uniref:ATP-binding cassette domain-containing protein n=1 Tax=Pseudoalteromonas spongiae TaxID=298657 RepID=A0ABU8F0J0_9GAMM